MRSLLDVNVLIALLDSDHVYHRAAQTWLADNVAAGWASCPLTQNGCIRILSLPSYPGDFSAHQVAERLQAAIETQWHEFWPDSISLLDRGVINRNRLLTSRQVTDVYLLGLAVRNGGRLVTFDRAIPVEAVAGAGPQHLEVI